MSAPTGAPGPPRRPRATGIRRVVEPPGETGLPGAHADVRPWTEIVRLEHLQVDRLHQQELDRRRQEQQRQDADRLGQLLLQQKLDPGERQELDRLRRQEQQRQDADRLGQLLLQQKLEPGEQQERDRLRRQQQEEQDADRLQQPLDNADRIKELQQLPKPQQQLLDQRQEHAQLLDQQPQDFVVSFYEHNNSDPLNQTKNLVWIEKNPLYKTALEDWDRTARLLTDRVDRKEKRSADLKNEIYQLVGFFTVLQGVVLTVVTQMTQSTPHTTCRKVWSPVLLTGLAWFVTSIGVGLKLRPIVDIDIQHKKEDYDRQEAVRRANLLRAQGPKFVFSQLKVRKSIEVPDYFLAYYAIIVMALSLFTGVFIASYFLILCNRGLAPISFASTPLN